MAMQRSTPEPTTVAAHLHDDHVAFERRFADLCARAQSDDWRELDAVWDDFADDLEDHFLFEEEQLFPRLRERDAEGYVLAARLFAEHEQIRSDVQLLGVQIQLHEVRAATIEALTNRLRVHAAIEDRCLYPWFAQTRGEVADGPRTPVAATPRLYGVGR